MQSTTIDVQARAACVRGREVWLARQQGGIVIYDSTTQQCLQQVTVAVDDKAIGQVTALASAHGGVWAATTDGELRYVDGKTRKQLAVVRPPGAEKRAALPDMSFVPSTEGGTGLLTVASATGRVFLFDSTSRRLVLSLSTYAPCTAVTQCFQSIVVAGDEEGALYAWDLSTVGPGGPTGSSPNVQGGAGAPFASTSPPTLINQASKSKVRRVHFEPDTETLWVARENGNLDVYRIDANAQDEGLLLQYRAANVGRVTGMIAVSGNVVATTFERKIVVLDAATAAVRRVQPMAHKSFIHGIAKVAHTEVAQVWSLGNDEAVRHWTVEGQECPTARPSRLSARTQAALALSPYTHLLTANSQLGITAARAQETATSATEDLRKAREEAQELRLRIAKLEETVEVKSKEVDSKTKRIAELEEAQAKLHKDVTEITSKVTTAEKEATMLQGDLSRLRNEVSEARTESSNRLGDKAKVEEDLARQRTEKLQMEQRLRDAESKLASVQAENARLCQAMGSVTAAQSAEKDVQNRILQNSAQTNQELQDARRLNSALSAVVASMEYTIHRREEEDKDIVALLNAYRRKVADRVTDPFLSALLVATMVRHPDRFDLECDDGTRAALLDRNGPFIQFVHNLRQSDPEAYEKLMAYLHQCTSAVGDNTLSAESRQLLDKFVSLAAKEGALGEDAILALKRSIPATVSAATPTGGVTFAGGASGTTTSLPHPTGTAGTTLTGQAAAGTTLSTTAGALGTAPETTGSGLTLPGATGGSGLAIHKVEEEFVGASLLRELRSQRAVEDSYVKEHRAMFEFILKTRRALVECLVLLQKRTVSAQQVVEALATNAAAGGSPTAPPTPSSARAGGKLLPLQGVFLGIVRELAELTSSVVSQYLTKSEKQRLNVQ